MGFGGCQELDPHRSRPAVAATRSLCVAALLLAPMSTGLAQPKRPTPVMPPPKASGPTETRPAASNPAPLKPATDSIHITTGALRMTGWNAPNMQEIKVTTTPLQMTGWGAANTQEVQVTTTPLQMTGHAN